MGCDLIGQFLVVPKTGWRPVLKRHLDAVGKALALAGDPEKLGQRGVSTEAIKEFGGLGIDFDFLCENECLNDDADALRTLRAAVDEARGFDLKGWGPRDGTWLELVVNGKKALVLFAGELSWGDEPEGAGYVELRALNRVGAFTALWEAVPWCARKRRAKRG